MATISADAEREDEIQYGSTSMTADELKEQYPNRPRNHSKTLPFSLLFKNLFNPLNDCKAQPAGGMSRKKGLHVGKLSPHEQRRLIIERFIVRWRKDVGNDFYPALRLILPDKDRDRGVYGLKENAIGRLLVKLMKIDKNSEDGYNLLHWKLPGQTFASRVAGDFAGRCFEVISKRPMRTEAGNMTIAQVNEQLDKLAASSGEAENLRVLETFYSRLNAEELQWIIRIILKELKIGATERTLLTLWHPDAEALFSVSSSLRRVCWELYNPDIRLESNETGISLMSCFQPQLAQWQTHKSWQKMVDHLRPTEDDPEFWIEEKLDGERMQMHMIQDPAHPGAVRFNFWSRRAKDYTFLYGNGLQDENSALTRHLKNAFAPGVRNLILDGEMITWDMETDKIVAFGTLKTAALSEQHNKTNSDAAGHRPVFRVFDILYLNDKQLTQYTLRDRRSALSKVIKPVHRRLEPHPYTTSSNPDAIEPLLREVVATASEGLVLKNPRSMYRLNSRNDDWIKVKPEYMSEFGESLDCVIIGGYYGSGKRGGTLSSFLCGLRVSKNHIQAGANPEKCFSFFKVGGGFRAEDYAEIRHHTEDKWLPWDVSNPPSEYIELGGGRSKQFEKPDLWIRPSNSVVLSVKAASVGPSDQFALGFTLRFPRFRRLRLDRTWDSALSLEEFQTLKDQADQESKEKAMTIENNKRCRAPKRLKKEIVIAGQDSSSNTKPAEFSSDKSQIFAGLEFCVLSESLKPYKKTKAELEALIKAHGGTVFQRAAPGTYMLLLADKKVVKVASLIKGSSDNVGIIRPHWLRDSITQGCALPFEQNHIFYGSDDFKASAAGNSDKFGDSYARDIDVDELRKIMNDMPKLEHHGDGDMMNRSQFIEELEDRGRHISLRSLIFQRCVVCFSGVDRTDERAADRLFNYVKYSGGRCVDSLDDSTITHVVLIGEDPMQVGELADKVRKEVSARSKVPRIVSAKWVEDCWKEKTLIDEEQYAVQ